MLREGSWMWDLTLANIMGRWLRGGGIQQQLVAFTMAGEKLTFHNSALQDVLVVFPVSQVELQIDAIDKSWHFRMGGNEYTITDN